MVPGPAELALPESLLEMQNLGPIPKLLKENVYDLQTI